MKKRINMNHPAHFIGAQSCKFFRATYVNGYVVSTVGDYHPMNSSEPEEIGWGRLYETMVFSAQPTPKDGGCPECPYVPSSFSELECEGYNDAGDAEIGHELMVYLYAEEKEGPR